MVAKDGKIHSMSFMTDDKEPPLYRSIHMQMIEHELYYRTELSRDEHRVMWETVESPITGTIIMEATLVANEHWEKIEGLQRLRRD